MSQVSQSKEVNHVIGAAKHAFMNLIPAFTITAAS